MKHTSLRIFGIAFLLAQAFTVLAQNPTPTPPAAEFLSITIVSVKPDMVQEFQSFMKNTTNPALKKGGLKWRDVWVNTTAAGDPFEYVLVAPMAKFSEFDGPSFVEKGLGAQGGAAWLTKASSLVNNVRRYIIRTRPDMSYQSTRKGQSNLAVITSVSVATGRNADFENYIKNDYLPVMKQANVSYFVSQAIFGGDANEYITLTMRDNFAELDKGPVIVQALGQEGAEKLIQKLPAGTVAHIERSITRLVPELSFGPAQ
jgi:hypothetical protein